MSASNDQLWEALRYALSMLMTAERSIEADTVERAEIATAVHYIDDFIRSNEDDTGARTQVPGGNPFAGEQVPGGNRAPTSPPIYRTVNDYDHDVPTPEVGSRWIWEPDKPDAFERFVVGEVLWNGEQWWVRTDSDKGQYWNSLSRFWEAVVPEPI